MSCLPTIATLGRRWRRNKHFSWMPGMQTKADGRGGFPEVRVGTPIRIEHAGDVEDGLAEGYMVDPVPDLSDPATRGCLLHQVREAWKDHSIHPRTWCDTWCVMLPDRTEVSADSELVALLRALEAAP